MKKLKTITAVAVVLTQVSCTIIGGKLGEKVDEVFDEDKYEEQYASEGLDIDIEILELLIMNNKKEIDIDDRACKEEGTTQICTTRNGCWCEDIR